MSGFVDFVMAKRTDAKAILKSIPNAGAKWPSVEWKWCFRPELAALLGILRNWPKKSKLKDKELDELEEQIPEVGTAQSDTIDEETSAMMGEAVYGVAGILWQFPPGLIELVAQINVKDDPEIAKNWHKYYDQCEPEELVELIQNLRELCQKANKEKKCVFLLDNCAY